MSGAEKKGASCSKEIYALWEIIRANSKNLKSLDAQVELAERVANINPGLAEELLESFYTEYADGISSTILPNSKSNIYRNPFTEQGLKKLNIIKIKADELKCQLFVKLTSKSQLMISGFMNPTGGGIRGRDTWGSGEYGASRDEGNRVHAGVDYLGNAGAPVYAAIGGTLEKIDDGARISGRVNGITYTVRQMHINCSASPGKIALGAQIGTVADLSRQYPGIQNHCHVELYKQPGDERLDPTPYFGATSLYPASVRPSYISIANHYTAANHECPDISTSPNQCAVRLSRALIEAGIAMDSDYGGNLCRHGYARGAQDLGAFLFKKWGQYNFGFSAPGNKPSQINKKKGLILFSNIPDFNGQGHIDLWDGEKTMTGEYWNADPIWFWTLT